ncbi:MAG: hypothetical protein ABIJ35_03535, partial [Acidobacteriota bacterium]
MTIMGKKIILGVLIGFLLMSGWVEGANRKGAIIKVITERNDQYRGELIAVKKDFLLILDSGSGYDVSIPLSGIRVVKILQNSQTVLGMMVGCAAGAALGYSRFKRESTDFSRQTYGAGGILLPAFAPVYPIVYGLAGTLVGGVVGAMIRPE